MLVLFVYEVWTPKPAHPASMILVTKKDEMGYILMHSTKLNGFFSRLEILPNIAWYDQDNTNIADMIETKMPVSPILLILIPKILWPIPVPVPDTEVTNLGLLLCTIHHTLSNTRKAQTKPFLWHYQMKSRNHIIRYALITQEKNKYHLFKNITKQSLEL